MQRAESRFHRYPAVRQQRLGGEIAAGRIVLVQRVDKAIGATHSYTRTTAIARRYIPLSNRLTGASRVVVQQTSGDVPLYDLATVQTSYKQEEGLGGSKMLRGIQKNRVVGKGLLVLNNEVRWRAAEFSPAGRDAHLVLSTFLDAGRVWDESIQFDELASDLWVGYGAGARVGIGPSFIVALDVGRSSEATQVYIGLGYAF